MAAAVAGPASPANVSLPLPATVVSVAGGAEFEDTVVVALGEVEITGRVESHAVRREEVHGGGGLAVASVGQFAMAGDGVHYVGLCESGGERRYPRQNCASKGLHKLSQMLERPRQEIKG